MKTLEIWKYAKGLSKVFTESYEMKQALQKDLGLLVCNIYDNPKGWDFIIGNDLVPKVQRIAKRVEIELLQD